MLARSAQTPALLQPRATPALIDALAAVGFLPEATAQALHGAHATLLEVGLACTLDRRPRLAPTTPAIEDACAAISAACIAADLPFA